MSFNHNTEIVVKYDEEEVGKDSRKEGNTGVSFTCRAATIAAGLIVVFVALLFAGAQS